MRIAVLFFLLLLSTPSLFAQKLTATVSRNPVGAAETFQLQFSLDASGSGFKAPDLSDFNVISGPNHSQSMQITNGSVSQSSAYSYYLSPKKEGKFTIGSASITLNGKKIESNPFILEVSKGAAAQKNQGNGKQGQPAQADASKLFVKTILNKTKVYQGEQVMLTYKVYARVSLVGFQNAKLPSYTGFWSQDIPNQTSYSVTRETLNGVQYSVVEFRKTFLFPQRSGTVEIDPIDIDCIVRQQSARSQDPWSFFGPLTEDVSIKIKGQGAKLEVMPLPETGKPKSFSGAVGQFSLKAQLNKEKVKANEALNITVAVTGRGNVNLVDPPKITIPPDIESYDPKPTENITVNAEGVNGTKTNEYVLVPRYHGTYKTEPSEFSYFDPSKKEYVTLLTPDFKIEVEKGDGENNSASVMTPLNNRKDVALIGNDIRYIKTEGIVLRTKGEHFAGTGIFNLWFILPGSCFLLFVIFRRKYRKDNSDAQLVRSRKATKMAKKRLALASAHLQSNNKDKFYEEVFRALYGYLGDKLSMPVSDLSKESITITLGQLSVSQETADQLGKTIDACEFARYAPSSASGDLKGIYDQSVELITKLEDEITRGWKSRNV